jgi:predicted HD phosphohydrolase
MAGGQQWTTCALLDEMRDAIKSDHHKQVLARIDDEVSSGRVSPILRAVFQFMMGRTPAQHRQEAECLRAEGPELEEIAQFHEVFADMLE